MIFELNTPYINNTFRHIKDVELSNFSIIEIVQTQGINIALAPRRGGAPSVDGGSR